MIADRSPDPYFVADVVEFVGHAWTFRLGELAGHTLVRHGPHLSQEDPESALVAWAENRQCLHAFGVGRARASRWWSRPGPARTGHRQAACPG